MTNVTTTLVLVVVMSPRGRLIKRKKNERIMGMVTEAGRVREIVRVIKANIEETIAIEAMLAMKETERSTVTGSPAGDSGRSPTMERRLVASARSPSSKAATKYKVAERRA